MKANDSEGESSSQPHLVSRKRRRGKWSERERNIRVKKLESRMEEKEKGQVDFINSLPVNSEERKKAKSELDKRRRERERKARQRLGKGSTSSGLGLGSSRQAEEAKRCCSDDQARD